MRLLSRPRLPPDAFAFVMATGIVSVAVSGAGERSGGRAGAVTGVSDALAWIAGVGFAGLAAFTVVAVVSRRVSVRRLADPDVALRACAFVAACGVLEFRLLGAPVGDVRWTFVRTLAILEIVGWLVLAVLAVRDLVGHTLAELLARVHGAWLLFAVATQSLAITAADLALDHGAWLIVPAIVWWVLGLLAYAAVAAMLLARVARAPALADEVTPDSWILMGGLAIATLAAARIWVAARGLPMHDVAGPARDAALACWAGATVWLPILAVAEAVRFAVRPGSWHFRAAWWATVFPLGMYAVASRAVGDAANLDALQPLSRTFAWISLACWGAVCIGLLHAGWRARDRVRLPAHPIARGTQ